MTIDNNGDVDILEFRKDFIRREIDVAASLRSISERISLIENSLNAAKDDQVKASKDQSRQLDSLQSEIIQKMAGLETVAVGQNEQIAALSKERAIMLSEMTALNEYINRITDRHHAKQLEMLPKPDVNLAVLSSMSELLEAVRMQAEITHREISSAISILLTKQNDMNGLLELSMQDGSPTSVPRQAAAVAELVPTPQEVGDADLILASGLFDSEWYRARYSLDEATPDELARHYLDVGYLNGFSPSSSFDGRAYTAAHRDVAAANLNPLIHYIMYGKSEGRVFFPCENKTVVDVY